MFAIESFFEVPGYTVELSFNCEKVALESPAKVPSHPSRSSSTLSKASISAGPLNVEPSLKGGVYISVGSGGTFKDVGVKGSVSGATSLDSAVIGGHKLGAGVEVEAESGFSFGPS